MRFESVTAHAFGPLAEQTLRLTKGLNVIYGPNEAGKSSWHAALYAGLCGQRRGAGNSADRKQFRERHRPWRGAAWRVSAIVRLEDGRRIELSHDLDGRVDCSAVDVDLGRDYSAEIIQRGDGAPDGARWLGLDRRSFLATACVRQADLLGVRDEPALLREQLERAAATAGADGTAARALELIEACKAERVGSARAPTRPLRQAQERVEQVRQRLETARRQQADYLELVARADVQDRVVAACRLRVEQARQTPPPQRERAASPLPLVLAGLAALVGLALLGLGQPAPGLVLLLAAAGLALWSRLSRPPERPSLPAVLRTGAEQELEEAIEAAARLRGQADALGAALQSVAEAEEALAQAEAERERLERLGQTLDLAASFLRQAQDRVHRDVAPLLAESVRRWLPGVTAGRYVDVRVDPERLEVQVQGAGGDWYPAAVLSHGTAEQVYLLLRVALAEHLTRRGETCPLVLDDVTVQSDAERTLAILQTLHSLSRERQVILFTQEDDVLRWAETELDEPDDRVVRLGTGSEVVPHRLPSGCNSTLITPSRFCSNSS